MTSGNVIGALILALAFTFLIFSPGAAYVADATTLYSQGQAATTTKNYTEALAAYNGAIALEPTYFEAWNGKADVLNRQKQYAAALAASNQSMAINPDYVEGLINRGQILYSIGYQYEDVARDMTNATLLYNAQLEAFQRAVALDPKNTVALFNEGFAYGGLKRFDEAIADFNKVKAINPDYPQNEQCLKRASELRDEAAPASTKYILPIGIGVAIIIGGVILILGLRMKKE